MQLPSLEFQIYLFFARAKTKKPQNTVDLLSLRNHEYSSRMEKDQFIHGQERINILTRLSE